MNTLDDLKAWRTENSLSQEAAGKLVGVSAATWCDWEGGKKSPSVDRALDLERVTLGRVTVAGLAQSSKKQRAERAGNREAAKPPSDPPPPAHDSQPNPTPGAEKAS